MVATVSGRPTVANSDGIRSRTTPMTLRRRLIRSRAGSPRSCTTGRPANPQRRRWRPIAWTSSPSRAWSPAATPARTAIA